MSGSCSGAISVGHRESGDEIICADRLVDHALDGAAVEAFDDLAQLACLSHEDAADGRAEGLGGFEDGEALGAAEVLIGKQNGDGGVGMEHRQGALRGAGGDHVEPRSGDRLDLPN